MDCFLKCARAYVLIAAVAMAGLALLIAVLGGLMYLASAITAALGGGNTASVILYIIFVALGVAAVVTYEHRHVICKKD